MKEVKPNKQTYIDFILIELEKGIEKIDCLAIIGEKWRIASRTFDRYWKTANEQYRNKQDLINKELTAISIDAEKQRLKKAIMTKDDILEKLTEIANAKAKKLPDGTILMPDYNNQISAMKTIVDIQGFKAITKTELSGKLEVEQTKKLDLSKLSDEMLAELDNLLEK